jgi:hypothetical protein
LLHLEIIPPDADKALYKIALTCVPTLAPLFTYFSEKSSNNYSRNYYSNAHELRSHGGGSRVINITANSKAAKEDADSDSQKGILDSQYSLDGRKGITKTVEVDVEYLGSRADGPNGKKF